MKSHLSHSSTSKTTSLLWVNSLLALLSLLTLIGIAFLLLKNPLRQPTEDTAVAYDNKPFDEWVVQKEKVEIPILMYHAIHKMDESEAAVANLIVAPEVFESHIKRLRTEGYYFLSPEEVSYAFEENALPQEKVVWLTFDDGNSDFYTEAYPILTKYHAKATNNIITGFTQNDVGLSIEQMKEMKKEGMSFQSHSITHPDLSTLSQEEQLAELLDSKSYLDKELKQTTLAIAYPSGKYSDDTLTLAADTYQLAVTTNEGIASKEDGLLSLNRIRILPETSEDLLIETINQYQSHSELEDENEKEE